MNNQQQGGQQGSQNGSMSQGNQGKDKDISAKQQKPEQHKGGDVGGGACGTKGSGGGGSCG